MSDWRKEATEAGARAWLAGRRDNYVSQTIAEAYEGAAAVIDAAEPIILAEALREWRAVDEQVYADYEVAARNTVLADLRAKVEQLPDEAHMADSPGLIWKSDVLALLDGESNG